MRQRRGVRRGAQALLARHHQTFPLQERPDGAGRRPDAPRLVPLQHALELSGTPAHVRLPELQDQLLEVLGRLVGMPVRGTAVLDQSGRSGLPVPAQPDIAGLAGDLIPLAEFGHRPFTQLVFKYKPQLLFHHTARFPWHTLIIYTRLPLANSVRNPPGLICQGCARSVPSLTPTPPINDA